MSRTVTPLVGRASELAAALAAIRQSSAGHSAALVVDGDAGVGKTRLMAEVVAAARSEGVCALAGHCVDLGDTPPPYLPFTEAFGRLALDEADLLAVLLAEHPELARILPRRLQPEVPAAGDRVERGDLFEAVLGALGTLAAQQPVLLIVEDAHWADEASRDLLGFLFARLTTERLALLVTYRSDDLHRRHPLRPTLAQWARLPAVDRLHLAPLAAADVRSLVRAQHPEPIPETQLARILDRADGNAFFAEELTAALDRYGTNQLPEQLADVMLVRLDSLSEAAREVVRVAAVAGRRVSHELLDEVVGQPPEVLDAALREAVEAHVVESTPSGRGYLFRHALLAEAVYDDLLPGERVRIHAAYARVLARRDRGNPAELARHARASHDQETAYQASVLAGDQAMALAAPREALRHYEVALELAPMVSTAPSDTSLLLLAAVEAGVDAGHYYRALKLARHSLDELPVDADPQARARLLYAFASAAIVGEIGLEPLNATAEALRLTPSDPPTPFLAELAALHARLLFAFDREVESERWARTAIEVAAAVGCTAAETDGHTTLARLLRRSGDPDEAVRLLAVSAERARTSGDPAAELRSRHSLASLHFELGRLGAAQDGYDETSRRAVELHRPWEPFGMAARAMAALVRYVRGDWDGALRTLDLSGQSPPMLAEDMFDAMALRVHAGRGEADQVLAKAAALRPTWTRDGRIVISAVMATLEIHEQQGAVADALALLDDAVASMSAMWQEEWFLGRIEISARVLAVLGSAAATATDDSRTELTERGAGIHETAHITATRGLPTGRALGVEAAGWLARADAEWARLRWLTGVDPPAEDEHLDLWRHAVDAFDYGDVVAQSWARARLAAVLRASGDTAAASAEAATGLAVARAMGAGPLAAEFRQSGAANSRAVGSRPGVGPRSSERVEPESLTAREQDVLGLLVEGRTNRQIAGQLYISEKTVSVHVSNILAKLGARGRSEAAAIARRDKLLA